MSNPSAINFWLPINKEEWGEQVSDLLSGGPVEVPCGCALQFNLAFYSGAIIDADQLTLSSLYSQIVFQILKPDFSTILVSQTIPSADFESATTAQFKAFTNAQVQVFIPSASNILTTLNGGPGNFILQIYGVDSDGAGDIDILCCFQINAAATGISAAASAVLSSASTARGATAIAAGAESGTITFAPALAYVPTTVMLTMQTPDANGNDFHVWLVGAPTSTGFNFQLSAATDRAGYVLHWTALQ